MSEQTTRQKALWIIGAIFIVIYTLLPVLWIIMLSFKLAERPVQPKLLPDAMELDNYDTVFSTDLFTTALRNSIGIVAHRDACQHRAGHLGRVRDRSARLPGQNSFSAIALAIAAFPVVSLVSPLFNMWRTIGPVRHMAGRHHPVGVVLAAAVDLGPLRVLPRDPVGDGTGRAGRRCDQLAGVPQGDRAAGRPWRLHRGHPRVLPGWNDFVFGVALTSTDRARPVPAALAFFTGASNFESPITAIAAAAVVVTIPVVLLVLIFQRRIVAGLTNGAVKG